MFSIISVGSCSNIFSLCSETSRRSMIMSTNYRINSYYKWPLTVAKIPSKKIWWLVHTVRLVKLILISVSNNLVKYNTLLVYIFWFSFFRAPFIFAPSDKIFVHPFSRFANIFCIYFCICKSFYSGIMYKIYYYQSNCRKKSLVSVGININIKCEIYTKYKG